VEKLELVKLRSGTGVGAWGSAIAAVALLMAIGAEGILYRGVPAGSDAYHACVRESAAQMPRAIGPWLSTDIQVVPGAEQLLRPNVLVARRFREIRSDRRFTFLFVQCRDARDMLGHYPPVCYAAQGWSEESAAPIDWKVDDLTIQGMRYHFTTQRREMLSEIVVNNFMILPDGSTGRGMEEVERASRQRQRKFFGAAQVHFVFDADFSETEQNSLIESVVRANRDTIDAIRSGS
jgi:hypothetical protein